MSARRAARYLMLALAAAAAGAPPPSGGTPRHLLSLGPAVADARQQQGPANNWRWMEPLRRRDVVTSWSSGRRRATHRPAAAFSKRQIRYHQCYFNPIACFRRRK